MSAVRPTGFSESGGHLDFDEDEALKDRFATLANIPCGASVRFLFESGSLVSDPSGLGLAPPDETDDPSPDNPSIRLLRVCAPHQLDVALAAGLLICAEVAQSRCPDEVWSAWTQPVEERKGLLDEALKITLANAAGDPGQEGVKPLLEATPAPTLVIDGQQRLLHLNKAAREILESQRHFKVANSGRVMFHDRGARDRLAEFMSTSRSSENKEKRAPDAVADFAIPFACSEGVEHIMRLRPLPADDASAPRRASDRNCLVRLILRDVPVQIEAQAIERVFGLTPSEAALVAALVRGEPLKEYCAAGGIKVATGRWHLHNVLQNVGCRNQAELVTRVLCALL